MGNILYKGRFDDCRAPTTAEGTAWEIFCTREDLMIAVPLQQLRARHGKYSVQGKI
ncbi:hypothetical protein MiSe_94840 [Microseira wollei NIES-4236]|uniref:Uncharacterized protein n=1 Tax=Microseira wollei NIES-4236 TaxID=2530354 RepID=A0AAV3XS32_9CYAN|nr:hypothetical protein MiSe_94840 [Microseira wollei NIES-4236]